jgi:lipopolysaccharide export system permease protein
LVPFANDQAVALRESAIKQVGVFGGGSHTVTAPLPGGGEQVTFFQGYEPATQSLLHVTIIKYGPDRRQQALLLSDRGHYDPPTWTFDNASIYQFAPDGTIAGTSQDPQARIDIGEKPTELQMRATDNNRETMSRSQIREIIASGQLSPQETRNYQTTYEEKLARPFACFVFTLIAAPFGLRPTRGGGTGFGFALSLGIAFLYFVIASISSAVSSNLAGGYLTSTIGAWIPNVLFTCIGAAFLLRAARS